MKSRIIIMWLAALLAVGMLAACGGDSQKISGDLAPDQTVRIRLDGEPPTIDPSLASFAGAAGITRNLFATLLRFDPVTGSVEPYAAKETPTRDNGGVAQDGLTYTFHLRTEAVWEDGRPITAKDFAYGILRTLDPRVASYYGQTYYSSLIAGAGELAAAVDATPAEIDLLKSQVGVKAVDDATLEIKVAQASSTVNLLFALWPTAAQRQDVVEDSGDISESGWTEPGRLLASGPFRLSQWEHGSRIVLEKNPRFWLEGLKPTLERIVFQIIEDENTAFAAYQRGDLDAAPIPLSALGGLSGSLQNEVQRVPLSTTFAVGFNHARLQFDTPRERQAFCASLDRQTLVQEIQQGVGTVSTSWLPAGLTPYFEADRGKKLAFDSKQAAAMLGADKDGYSSAKLSFANVDPNLVQAEYIQGQWQQNLGLSLKIEPLDPPAFGETFLSGNFDLVLIAFTEDYHHPENWLLQWKSDSFMNLFGYQDSAFDDAVGKAMSADGDDSAVRLWRDAERILIDEDAAICPLVSPETVWAVKPYVRDFVITGADGIPGDFFYWKTAVLAR